MGKKMKQKPMLIISMIIFILLAVSVLADINTVNTLSNNLQTMNLPQIDGIKQESKFITNLFTGSAGYSYPLNVIPGINGFQPSIALSYNHHSTKEAPGVLGNAWTITQSYVYRDTQYTVSDTSDDKFWLYLNGVNEELVLDTQNNRYHTKHEIYMWIQKISGVNNQNGEYWIVKTKDGTIYRLGYNQDSELASNIEDYTVKWSLDLVTDTHGNEIEYLYNENPENNIGVAYLDEINYGESKIKFSYNFDLISERTMFVQGNKVKQNGILSKIEVEHADSLVRRYTLEYENYDNMLLLKSITEVGSDGTISLPPTEFTYNLPEKGWTKENAYEMPDYIMIGAKNDNGVRFIDYNNDGYTDILKMKGTNKLERWKNNGQGWYAKEVINNFMENGFIDGDARDNGVRFVDANKDVRVDMIQKMTGISEKERLLISNGNSWDEG